MAGPQSERTRMLCQRVLTCSVVKQKDLGWKMEAWCWKWHPRVQKSSTGAPGLLPHSSHEHASMKPRLVLPCDIISSLSPRFHSVP